MTKFKYLGQTAHLKDTTKEEIYARIRAPRSYAMIRCTKWQPRRKKTRSYRPHQAHAYFRHPPGLGLGLGLLVLF